MKHIARYLSFVASCLLVGLLNWVQSSNGAFANDRALLVGVGKYNDPRANLVGVDLDIEMMKDVASLLGFRDSQIRVLQDEQATLQAVEQAIESWLIKGVSKDDRVLFYFTGHGTRIPDENGDEEDGADEVLVTYDAKVVRRDGKATLENVLVDDRFHELLTKIKSEKVFVVIDACHSGTATKNLRLSPRYLGETEGMVKFFYYAGMPMVTKGNFADKKKVSIEPYVAVAAAADDEKAIATPKGSVFTLGISDAVRKAAQQGSALTATKLKEHASTFVGASVSPARRFHPQLTGNLALAQAPFQLTALKSGRGPVWQKLEEIVKKSEPLSIQTNGSTFRLGQSLIITVDVKREGYLNIVNVGPDDEPTVLFPNKFHPDNFVQPGKLQLPTDQMKFDLRAQEPVGPSLTVAMLTNNRVNLRESSLGKRDEKGEVIGAFGTLSPQGVRAVRGNFAAMAKSASPILAGQVLLRVCKSGADCP